jgi:hypothetical protein
VVSHVVPQLEGDAPKAVLHRGSHLQITVSAGSGKAEVVAQRLAQQMADGEAPASIIAFTFTERTGRQLKARIKRTLPRSLPPSRSASWPQSADAGLCTAAPVTAWSPALLTPGPGYCTTVHHGAAGSGRAESKLAIASSRRRLRITARFRVRS